MAGRGSLSLIGWRLTVGSFSLSLIGCRPAAGRGGQFLIGLRPIAGRGSLSLNSRGPAAGRRGLSLIGWRPAIGVVLNKEKFILLSYVYKRIMLFLAKANKIYAVMFSQQRGEECV